MNLGQNEKLARVTFYATTGEFLCARERREILER
jgi:hypothetical protein